MIAEYLVMAVAYLLGGILVAVGLFLVRRRSFPAWWKGWMLWPIVRVTPRVTHLQGWAAIGIGISILAIGFTPLVPDLVGGVFVLVAILGYLIGVALFLYSTWLSRRVAS
jgi:hypothetical protein